jgi:TolB-like protein
MGTVKEDATKQMEESSTMLDGLTKNLTSAVERLKQISIPAAQKDITHKGVPVRVTLTKTGEVVIKFADDDSAQHFYNTFGE